MHLAAMFEPASFDAILCHGVLMYLPCPEPLLAGLLADGGLVSLLVRNGDALAMRPGPQGDWTTARAAFDNAGYVNRMGISARADRLTDLTAALAGHQLQLRAWYGVRVFTDAAADGCRTSQRSRRCSRAKNKPAHVTRTGPSRH